MKRILSVLLIAVLTITALFCISACTTKNEDGDLESPIAKGYTVQFAENGGSEVESKKVSVLMNAPTTTKADHLFDGWYMDKDLTNPAMFPLELKYDVTLYAKWLQLADTMNCPSTSIKFWEGSSSSSTIYLTPAKFDLEKLAKLNYSMEITVSYRVYYTKDYSAPMDVGYAGAPKYELYLVNSDDFGEVQEDITAPLQPTTKTATFRARVVDLTNQKIRLTLSTDNIQNTIYFDNICVSYRCIK